VDNVEAAATAINNLTRALRIRVEQEVKRHIERQ
jgi:hypothetical protein